MKRIFFCVIGSSVLFAHPGIGIVQDSKGNIFYTDLKHVWMISVDGKKTIAVPDVHTHELYIDANDELFGEHLWYNGERLNTWGHYVWKYSVSRKTLERIIPATKGFLHNYSFIRDTSGTMYWIDRSGKERIKKKTRDGKISFHSNAAFTQIGWLHCTSDGDLFFIDSGNLIHIAPNEHVKIIVKYLDERTARSFFTDDNHNILGIWTDSIKNVYLAVNSAKKIKKVSPDGKITIITTSSTDWSPSSGLIDRLGRLWLMEYNKSNTVRIRRIDSATSETIF